MPSTYSASDELINNLVLDYEHYTEKRRKAVLRCNTEYVADLDARLRVTRKRLEAAVQVQQESRRNGEHELIKWAKAGYPPVVEHERPLSEPEYIVPIEPTWADWHRAASRYVETGSKEHYALMLTMVRLDHPVPRMWAEADTVKTTEKTSKPLTLFGLWTTPKPLTLADIWYGSRWYVLIFTLWAISIVVGINLFT